MMGRRGVRSEGGLGYVERDWYLMMGTTAVNHIKKNGTFNNLDFVIRTRSNQIWDAIPPHRND